MRSFFISVLNSAWRLKTLGIPSMAALGNVPCSSSAMCIAPVGIVNACNPRYAANQAHNLSSLIHVHDASFCQDGAAAIAASVAAAFDRDATVDSILDAATRFLSAKSGARMSHGINRSLETAQRFGNYTEYRKFVYDHPEDFLQMKKNNALETVPLTLALFLLSEGNFERSVTYAVNFGRDADTMAAMAGAIAGTFQGLNGIRKDWIKKATRLAENDLYNMAESLANAAIEKIEAAKSAQRKLEEVISPPQKL